MNNRGETMLKIRNEHEKEKYFNEHIKEDGAHFKVKYLSGEEEFIWVKRFEEWKQDGSNWYLESSNQLMKHDITGVNLEPYHCAEDDEIYIPFDHCYVREEIAYEIVSWQTSPFLPDEFEIEFITSDETEAIKYMIELENH